VRPLGVKSCAAHPSVFICFVSIVVDFVIVRLMSHSVVRVLGELVSISRPAISARIEFVVFVTMLFAHEHMLYIAFIDSFLVLMIPIRM
jgi:hypothetical protein